MKKKTVLTALSAFSVLAGSATPVVAESTSPAQSETGLFAYESGSVQLVSGTPAEKIAQLEAKFPEGKYWNHPGDAPYSADTVTDVPCTDHSTLTGNAYNCNEFDRAWQCVGFAYLCFYEFNGYSLRDRSKSIEIQGSDGIQPGDAIYYGTFFGSEHWKFVSHVDHEKQTITIMDCNSGGNCRISRSVLPMSSVSRYLTSKAAAANKTPEPVDPPVIKVPEPIPGQIPSFRVYNRSTGEHFYTQNAKERESLILGGWKDEGVSWYSSEDQNVPVYRVYNPNTTDHHYTTDADEKDALVKAGWKDEGISWYSEAADHTPLYRLYNPNAKGAGSHHYTKDATEKEHLINLGWKDEGTAWYVL